jgi:putative ABC transport system ATP-binding protein
VAGDSGDQSQWKRGGGMSGALIEATHLEKAFGRTEALRGATLSVAPGEIVAITGPSGSGKSTLLLCMSGVLRPDAGSITYAGTTLGELSERDLARLRRRQFGLVLQFGQLVPELTAVQNVALPLLLEGQGASSRATARAWLERLGAWDVADALPGELSGGESQRVAVARALVATPKVVFADEPTGALDQVGGEQVLAALLAAAKETGAAVVLVTHDNRVAAHAGREIVLRDGRVETTQVTT